MREQVERALRGLLRLRLWNAKRVLDVQMFDFGQRRTVVTPLKKRVVEAGEYALHVQCAWRITGPAGILVGVRDRFYPTGNPYQEPSGWDWNQGPNRCDERVAAFFQSQTDSPLAVEAIETDAVGGFRLILTGGFALDVFPDESLPGEHWRPFQPGNEKTHFVVTGMGLHPAKQEELLMARRKVRTDPEILHDAIVDGINVYMREVLLGRGVLDHRRLEEWAGPDLDDLKHEVASRVAGQWETCEIDEKA